MTKKRKALAEQGQRSESIFYKGVDKSNKISSNDQRVLELLSKGRYNVIQIAKILNIPDPRSNIRYLRKAGFRIADYWIKTTYSRCKVYFFKHIGGNE